ncbi:MAG TPA: helix-turn-helix domain-containing protein [Candidatus Limnocylindrales bacterium]|nr:helix-turn-helix domain-containing protein [Candidatus Limnocylindrales bacterium]
MDLTESEVKPKRRYDASRRRRRADEARDRILAVARRLFLANGYSATSLSRIADEADVSVETIYKSLGGKAGVVRALWERALEGSGPIPAERRSDEMQARETDPRRIIESWAAFVMELAPIGSPILLLARTAAASDADLAELLEKADQARAVRMEHNARGLLERGLLRGDVSLEEARDVCLVYSSAELYELLVIRQGWPIERYGHFVARGMMAALLPDMPPGRPIPLQRKSQDADSPTR